MVFFPPTKVGRPKYDSNLSISLIPNNALIKYLCWGEVLLLKKTEDLSMFIHWPEASAYNCKISNTAFVSLSMAWQNKRESSANRRCEIRGARLQMDTPWIFPSNSTFYKREVNPFAHKRKRQGDKRSPWWIPLEGWIIPYGFPFIETENEGDVTQLITLPTQSPGKPSFSMIFFKKSHSTLS